MNTTGAALLENPFVLPELTYEFVAGQLHGILEAQTQSEHEAAYNAAHSSVLTRGVSRAWDTIASPLIEPFANLTERNRLAGIIAVNATFTAPRILDVGFAALFAQNVEAGDFNAARRLLLYKFFLKSTDGIDGAVARGAQATSSFGALFDPAVDLAGSAADIWAIMKLAKREDDITVKRMMLLGFACDAGSIATGGLYNGFADLYCRYKRVPIPPKQKAHSNAESKAKYFIRSAGNGLLLFSYTCEDPEQKANYRRNGLILNAASDAIGAVGIRNYTTTANGKLRLARAH